MATRAGKARTDVDLDGQLTKLELPRVIAGGRGSRSVVVDAWCQLVTAEPFEVSVTEAEIADLRDRLHRTRWPEPEPVDDWSQGLPLAYAQELCRSWAEDYDFGFAERLDVSAYTVPTDRPESDGTLEWDSTTMVLVEASAGAKNTVIDETVMFSR